MERPLVSVIVPTFNRSDMLRDALESLLRQETGGELSYEIVVVDNASTDATREVVGKMAAGSPVPVHYVYQTIPGDAPSRNCGVAHAQGKWLAFFDDDQLAAPNWIRQLYHAARETGASIVGGAVHLDLPETVLRRLGHDVRRTSLREFDYYRDVRRYDGKHLPGCGNALVARRVLETIGHFDASMAWGGSDSDFFLRARTAGLELYYTPHAVIRHRIPPNRLSPEYIRWDARQGCDALACQDLKRRGRLILVPLCLARIAQAALLVAPRLAWAWLRRDPGGMLGQRMRLWRVEGYVRRTLAILAPRRCAQPQYFAYLKFRQGRSVAQQATRTQVTS